MTTGAYRRDLMLHEDTHTLTHKHDTLLLTQTVTTVHCTRLAFATGSYKLSEEIETLGYLAPHWWRGASDVWLQ